MGFQGVFKNLAVKFKDVLEWLNQSSTSNNYSDVLSAKVVDRFILAVVIAMVPLSSFLFVITPGIRNNLYIGLFGCACLLILRIPLKQGKLTLVAVILATMFVVFPSVMLYFIGSIRNVFTSFYLISLIISAFLLNTRMTLFFSGLSFISLSTLFLLERSQLLPIQSPPSTANQYTLFVIILLLTTIIFRIENINRGTLQTALQQVQEELLGRKQVEEQLNHNALHDGLTHLPNRNLLRDRIELALNQNKRNPNYKFAVLFLDLDRFKVINDSLGHAVGDQLLITFADKLRTMTRAVDLAARLGGDEFVLLLNEISNYHDAVDIAQRILDELKEPLQIDGKRLSIGSSIGIAYNNGNNGSYTTADEILRDADIAMYQSKENGKNCYTIFDDVIHTQVMYRLELENDFHEAIQNSEFLVYYQPIFELESNTIAGFEALARWEHPEKGLISPNTFIPIAEETGLIRLLNHYIISTACPQFLAWKESGVLKEKAYLSVNLSPHCLEVENYVPKITELLKSLDFDPKHLTFEITEGVLIDNIDRNIEVLEGLQAMGIHISIDDFGTGYSSLSYLHRLPLDNMKIDRSFVMGMNEDSKNHSIVETIITLAKSLNMHIIAEGIETSEQLNQLKLLDCNYGQGFLYSKPLDASATETYLQALEKENSLQTAA